MKGESVLFFIGKVCTLECVNTIRVSVCSLVVLSDSNKAGSMPLEDEAGFLSACCGQCLPARQSDSLTNDC